MNEKTVALGSELNDGLGVGRNLYTYVVEHENDYALRFHANMEVNGGKLQVVAFYDALERLEKYEEVLHEIASGEHEGYANLACRALGDA